MKPRLRPRMSPAAALLLQGIQERTVFERDYALHTFIVGIEEAMEKENINKTELARMIGVKNQAISRALKGKQNLTVGTLMAIAVALKKTVDFSIIDLPEIEEAVASRDFETDWCRAWSTNLHSPMRSVKQARNETDINEYSYNSMLQVM